MKQELITPAVIIWQKTLEKVPLIEFDFNNKNKNSLSWHEERLKSIVGYKLGNIHWFLKTQLIGTHFKFMVSFHAVMNPRKDFHWEVSVWDNTGNRTIGCYRIDSIDKETDMMPREIFDKIILDCEDDIQGLQKCSGCGKKVKHSEVAGQYFAGRYCKECWESKYKAIEAAETYN